MPRMQQVELRVAGASTAPCCRRAPPTRLLCPPSLVHAQKTSPLFDRLDPHVGELCDFAALAVKLLRLRPLHAGQVLLHRRAFHYPLDAARTAASTATLRPPTASAAIPLPALEDILRQTMRDLPLDPYQR